MPVLLGLLVLRLVLRSASEGCVLRACAHEYRERIRDAGVPARVAPAPHGMQACCGTSVMLDPADVDRARAVIDEAPYPIERIVRVAGAVDPSRDKFC